MRWISNLPSVCQLELFLPTLRVARTSHDQAAPSHPAMGGSTLYPTGRLDANRDSELMHVCLVMGGTGSGGLERNVSDLARELALKHRVTVLAHPIHAHLFPEPVVHVHLDFGRWRHNPIVTLQFVRAIKRLRPDVIHAHHRKAGAMVRQASPFLTAPLILTIHGMGKANRIAKAFDHVIGVSECVTANINHPCKSTVLNGNG